MIISNVLEQKKYSYIHHESANTRYGERTKLAMSVLRLAQSRKTKNVPFFVPFSLTAAKFELDDAAAGLNTARRGD